MMFHSHVAAAGAAFGAVAAVGVVPFEPALLGITCIGGLLPDIDHHDSWMGHRTRPLSTVLHMVLGHRTWTHSVWALGLIAAAAMVVPWQAALALWLGYASHLAADSLTTKGIPLFLHVAGNRKRPWGPRILRYGSLTEQVLALLFAGFTIASWTSFSGATFR